MQKPNHPWTQETVSKMASKVRTADALDVLKLLQATPAKEAKDTAKAIKEINGGKR